MGESSQSLVSPTDESLKKSKRAVFILSDWHSVDDPKPYTRLLCEWDIVPVFIGFGRVNLQVREDLVSACGYAFQHRTSSSTVMDQLKVGVPRNRQQDRHAPHLSQYFKFN